jgi:hypothetical protein
MSFSCTIRQGKKDLTSFKNGVISSGLFGLAPNSGDDTYAPHSLSDIRQVVNNSSYAHSHKPAAIDCFITIQQMIEENLDSLDNCHCDTCTCEPEKPSGWSVEEIKKVLEIDAAKITSVSGGW